ncbi:putative peroxiredoxin [Kineosphaera limosa NBRC 100340]|uniref:Alkyl hydroperoxide reductase E n=2 Tax=Kineosphaera TaxID=211469 RepID=K6VFZ2_9MICO|nr:putative peroxiredoxin [Kineosphaera limosa NBRC 100340]
MARHTGAMAPQINVGDKAPDFTLSDQYGTKISTAELRQGRGVLVVFFPFAFSGICTGELTEIRDDLGAFQNEHVVVVAVSCDPVFSLRAWDDREGYFFPLLSDFWPHGGVARQYGVFDEAGGFAHRGTFFLDPDGIVRWCLTNAPGERRDFSGFHETLNKIIGA